MLMHLPICRSLQKWHDTGILQLHLAEAPPPPAPERVNGKGKASRDEKATDGAGAKGGSPKKQAVQGAAGEVVAAGSEKLSKEMKAALHELKEGELCPVAKANCHPHPDGNIAGWSVLKMAEWNLSRRHWCRPRRARPARARPHARPTPVR
jgi:hypothetical protein